jgi:dienelactone hydrolase
MARRDVVVSVPADDVLLEAAVSWPAGGAEGRPRPAVVFNHGSPLTRKERVAMTLLDYEDASRWFVDRGYVVVAALRRGFGASQARFVEGVDRDSLDYAHAGRMAARDIRAALAFTVALPGVDPARIVLAGHSAGGFGSLALESEGAPVRGVVSFAGGKGAQHLGAGVPQTTAIAAAAGTYGRTARAPSLWIYADNDTWFEPPVAAAMFASYRAAGGPADLVKLPAIGADGHELFTPEGERLWAPALERFLARVGM